VHPELLSKKWTTMKKKGLHCVQRPRSVAWYFGIAALAGLIIGLGGLTRYSFLWLLFPSLLFVGVYVKSHKVPVILTTLAVTMVLVGPWLVRNYQASGTLFGISSYNVAMDTSDFQKDRIERSYVIDNKLPGF
jgi:hypothetical protein